MPIVPFSSRGQRPELIRCGIDTYDQKNKEHEKSIDKIICIKTNSMTRGNIEGYKSNASNDRLQL